MFYTFSGKHDRNRKKSWSKWLVRRIQLQKRSLAKHCSNPPHTLGSFFSSLFTESQDGSGWRGPLWLIWSHLPSQAHGTGLCPEGSGRSPVREAPQPLRTICSVLSHCIEKQILHVQVELLGISSCSFLLLHCWVPPAAVRISFLAQHQTNHPWQGLEPNHSTWETETVILLLVFPMCFLQTTDKKHCKISNP